MHEESRQCQNCKSAFTIDAADFSFYEKIKVPPPTWCPTCRLQRRLAFFNVFNLYKRPCDLCKENPVSLFAPDAPYTVYCPKCWWSDKWNPLDYGREYDFSRPFFEQFNELFHTVPLLGLNNDLTTNVNSTYNNLSGNLKDCHLLFHADFVENSAYGFHLNHAKDILDSSLVIESELCYDVMHSYKNSRCAGLRSQVTNSIDSYFLKDSFNCQNCFASANLRNKKYYIFNKPYSKEGYFEEIKKWDLGSYRVYQEVKNLAEEHWAKFPPKPAQDDLSVNYSGSHVFQSKNCKQCFEVVGAEDSKYLLLLYNPPIRDCYDVSSWGVNISRLYECTNCGENSSDMKFCHGSGINLFNAEYCELSLGGSHHFGCVSMRKGEHVVLNKRYSKEAYETLRAKIIEHMNNTPYTDKKGRVYRYGEFFPVEMSPFGYNETIASNFSPLSLDGAEENGYGWRVTEKKRHIITVNHDALPDHIKGVSDEILKETIGCKRCGRGFRIIPAELDFLRKMNFPLPRECPFCRIQDKFNQWVKNVRLIPRTCDTCGKSFETKYTVEEAPHILCKECYQQEVA